MQGGWLFGGSVAWKVLAYFFEEPLREEHVNGIARGAGVGAGSASVSCKLLCRAGLLNKKTSGNALFYSLSNGDPLVRRLKSAWFLEKMLKFRGAWENDEFISVALYGSCASGEFVGKSDADVLVISSVPAAKVSQAFASVKAGLGREVSLLCLPLSDWVSRARKRDRFLLEAVSNHVLLWGSSLVV